MSYWNVSNSSNPQQAYINININNIKTTYTVRHLIVPLQSKLKFAPIHTETAPISFKPQLDWG